MKVKLKQRFLSKVFMGVVLTSSLFHEVKAAGTEFESTQSDDDYCRQQVESLSTESVKKIGAKIREYQGILAQAKGKNLVVFLGNTGAGKSTSINILGNKRLIINEHEAFELAPCEDGLLVAGGRTSVTQYPQHISAGGLGVIFDMPGFEDTGGATKDIINAALTKYLLENARSVRAILTVSEQELGGLRGKGLQSVLKHIRMLSEDFRNESVGLLVTKVKPSRLKDMNKFYRWIKEFLPDHADSTQIERWMDAGRVFGLPAVNEDDNVSQYIKDNQLTLETHIAKLSKTSTGVINVAMTLGDKSSEELKEFFIAKIAEQLKESVENDWPNMVREFGAGQFKESKKTVLDRFIQKLEASEEIHLLKPLGTQQYNKTLSSFTCEQGAFSKELSLFLAKLEVKEQERIIEEANARAEKAKAEAATANTKAATANTKVADEKENQAGATTEADKKIADAKVRKAVAEAETAEAEAATAKAKEKKAVAKAETEIDKGKKVKAKEAEEKENRNSSWAVLTNLRSAVYNALSTLYTAGVGWVKS
jgi:GTP-binding protein EngB required for normal cell division